MRYDRVKTGELAGVAVPTQMPDLPANWIKLKANAENAGRVAFGGEDALLPNGDDGEGNGYVLAAGEETPWLPLDKLSRLWYVSDNAGNAVTATVDINPTGDDNNFTLTALRSGVAGNDITITLTDPSGNSQPLVVTVAGTDIDVSLATNGGGTITSTAAAVIAAINAHPAASALVLVEADGTVTGVVAAVTETPLATGADGTGDNLHYLILGS